MDDLPPIVSKPITPRVQPAQEGISTSRPLIFAILFGVTGAIGLPLLWASPVFTRKEKVLWSVIVIIYTLVLLAIAGASIMFLRHAIMSAGTL